jgi:hypothetical protein
VIKTGKRPVINGGETAQFKWCLIRGTKRGGGGNGRRMQCRDQGSDSMAGDIGVVLEGGGGTPFFWVEGGRRGQGGPRGSKGRTGRRGRWANWAKI